jgi:hypothetical protein
MKNKPKVIPILTIAAISVLASSARAQFAIDWSTIDGGGGTSTGGAYTVSGTTGQPDAAWPVDQNGFPVRSIGGNYTLVGGFWSIIQNSLPPLKIERRLGNLVLSWPADAAGVVVQSATQLTGGGIGWSNFVGEPTRVGDQFELVVGPALTPPNPIRFFRLFRQ